MSENIKFLAYYLPQFHPIPENDLWWGKGFTEWTNVAKAKPLFKGHYQPILPADLGFYDLRLPEVQEAQANLAKEYGIDGFIYYQYWFGNGKMLLEKPAEAMLQNEKVDIPFCFCWANETWKGIWHGLDNPDILIEQTYQGGGDYEAYFDYLLPFFKDKRYIKVDNKPMFHVYRIQEIPDWCFFIESFNQWAIDNGFDGIHFINGTNIPHAEILMHPFIKGEVGTDVFSKMRYQKGFVFQEVRYLGWLERRIKTFLGFTNHIGKRLTPLVFDYSIAIKKLEVEVTHSKYLQCVFPNWDNSARSGKKSLIFKNATPESWKRHLEEAVKKVYLNENASPFIIIKSWNEWAEGNHLEPDQKFGHRWLEVVKETKRNLVKNEK
ncbi:MULTISPECIES: glycosyltransferase WbsX family protein [Flavobacterium]|uniref:glycosyltransferase WbsX family protein n=1 Tax=Flavobacterium TaxID=237 RepID=UPI001FCB393B|nr:MULTISPECIES: glycoside hydrolase family 99-like domain-containing protein [Flavobacterium]UOK43785.1 glycoside hydrolase family 99-like domain-containing protein [Flavobacterium enshiense]